MLAAKMACARPLAEAAPLQYVRARMHRIAWDDLRYVLAVAEAGSLAAAARTLGVNHTTVLRRVTLPLVLPGLASGAVLSFARALGEFGATITFAGSLQGVTRTLPLEIYLQRETDADAAVALSLVLVVVAML